MRHLFQQIQILFLTSAPKGTGLLRVHSYSIISLLYMCVVLITEVRPLYRTFVTVSHNILVITLER